jgi:hypothetical protein
VESVRIYIHTQTHTHTHTHTHTDTHIRSQRDNTWWRAVRAMWRVMPRGALFGAQAPYALNHASTSVWLEGLVELLLVERYSASARASLCLIWSQGPCSDTPRTRTGTGTRQGWGGTESRAEK